MMMNAKEEFNFQKGVDFEDYSVDVDSWTAYSTFRPNPSNHTVVLVNEGRNNNKNSGVASSDSLVNILTQSIEIIGSAVAPWPISLSTEQSGLFLRSESEATNDSDNEAIKSSSSSRSMRRSNSSNRRVNISRINKEIEGEALQIYSRLQPVPIIVQDSTSSSKKSSCRASKCASPAESPREHKAPTSKIQSWLSAFYSRSQKSKLSQSNDCETGAAAASETVSIKSILKKSALNSSNSGKTVQKSVNISASEAQVISQTPCSNPLPVPEKLRTSKLRFHGEVKVCETFHKEDYSRQSVDYIARQLTPALAMAIKQELNSVKQEMEVHEESRHHTQFYAIKN